MFSLLSFEAKLNCDNCHYYLIPCSNWWHDQKGLGPNRLWYENGQNGRLHKLLEADVIFGMYIIGLSKTRCYNWNEWAYNWMEW